MMITIEQAKKDRVSRTGFKSKPSTIKAGEKCLVLKNQHGWSTNVRKKDATKILERCLKDLNQTPKLKLINQPKGKTMNLNPTVYMKPQRITLSPNQQVGLASVTIVAGYFLAKKIYHVTKGFFNEPTDRSEQKEKDDNKPIATSV